ncbi:MAG: hypothetical protein JWO03_1858 [Bacteroidetes bacterium]|nr:hypothetical protein [Bacteroidota bacterium]
MKRNIAFIFFAFLVSVAAMAQTRSASGVAYKSGIYDVFIIEIDTHSVHHLSIIDNPSSLSHSSFVSQNVPSRKISFAMSAPTHEDQCVPTGLYVTEGREVNGINLRDGSTNFYKKPNGALIITNDDATVVESNKISGIKNLVFALQSGPMLVIDKRIHPEFQPKSKNKSIRCGVGVFKKDQKSYLVFAISQNTVKFYEFASFFKDYYGCSNALTLGGGKCSMYASFLERSNPTDGDTFCRYILYK